MDFLLVLFVLLLIFLNGATDASNAIASAVSGGALSMGQASVLASVCNTAGGIAGMLFFGKIRQSTAENAAFGEWEEVGTLAVIAAVVLFTCFAWICRLPTSESHALLAASAGASLVLGGSEDSMFFLLRPAGWMLLSVGAGFCAGALVGLLLPRFMNPKVVRRMQIFCAAGASFLHGVQDLAKFLALLAAAKNDLPPLILLAAAGILGLGTLCGGRRMTEAVGQKLASLCAPAALAADLGSAAALLFLSWTGIPASTTHTRTCAVAAETIVFPGCRLHGNQLMCFGAAWLVTFPVCGLLAAVLALFLRGFI